MTFCKIHDIIKLWVDGSEDGYFSGYDKKDNLKFIKKTKTVKENGEDKTYYSRVAVTPVWKDSKGNEYPVYMSSTGSCFVIKTSAKTGKEYRNYLGPEISEQMCKELNVEYKGKKKL